MIPIAELNRRMRADIRRQNDEERFSLYNKECGPHGNMTGFHVEMIYTSEQDTGMTQNFSFMVFMPGHVKLSCGGQWTEKDVRDFIKREFSGIISFAIAHSAKDEHKAVLQTFEEFKHCSVLVSCQIPVYGEEPVTRPGIALGLVYAQIGA